MAQSAFFCFSRLSASLIASRFLAVVCPCSASKAILTGPMRISMSMRLRSACFCSCLASSPCMSRSSSAVQTFRVCSCSADIVIPRVRSFKVLLFIRNICLATVILSYVKICLRASRRYMGARLRSCRNHAANERPCYNHLRDGKWMIAKRGVNL